MKIKEQKRNSDFVKQ